MADKKIGDLPRATSVNDASLLVMEQQGEARAVEGRLIANFAKESVNADIQRAVNAADNAEVSAQESEASALVAKQYSGKPPVIQNRTWWTWNADTQEYEDTGEIAVGGITYATFSVDPSTGRLTMRTDASYSGPDFALNNGRLEVVI